MIKTPFWQVRMVGGQIGSLTNCFGGLLYRGTFCFGGLFVIGGFLIGGSWLSDFLLRAFCVGILTRYRPTQLPVAIPTLA